MHLLWHVMCNWTGMCFRSNRSRIICLCSVSSFRWLQVNDWLCILSSFVCVIHDSHSLVAIILHALYMLPARIQQLHHRRRLWPLQLAAHAFWSWLSYLVSPAATATCSCCWCCWWWYCWRCWSYLITTYMKLPLFPIESAFYLVWAISWRKKEIK